MKSIRGKKPLKQPKTKTESLQHWYSEGGKYIFKAISRP